MLRNFSYRIRRSRFRRNKFRRNKFSYNNFNRHKPGVAIIIAGVIFMMGVIMLFPHFIRNTYNVTVTNKQVIMRNNANEYLIYAQTEDGEIRVFENTNNFLELKFNSEDLYMAISINKKYEIKAYGFNMPLFSNYQNIVKAKGL